MNPDELRAAVRSIVDAAGIPRYACCDAWMRGHDPAFSARLAEAGLIGLSWPAEYGGRGASSVDRLVVTEELLRVGAPVAAHWIADRQIGPAILRHGSASLRARFLPRIASGEVTFCLGMSETESGSDLAAVRTRAVPDGTGFRLTGSKIWTSHAHRSTHAYVLARTPAEGGDGGAQDRHATLTEFVVDLATPGITVRPIYDLAGEHHFNEVTFDNVLVPGENVLGMVGNGWRQVTEQLAFERGGMERVLSTYPLLASVIEAAAGQAPDVRCDERALGELVARLHALRAMALSIAADMDHGHAPVQRAALLKYLGTGFEYDVVEFARDAVGQTPDPDSPGLRGLLASAITAVPGASIRGGATEVLLGIVARSALGERGADDAPDSLRAIAGEVLAGMEAEPDETAPRGKAWTTAVELGWTGIGVAEPAGGSGGTLRDLADIAWALGRHGHSVPVAETALAAALRTASGRAVDVGEPAALALGPGLSARWRGEQLVLSGTARDVVWGAQARWLVAAVAVEGEVALVEVDSRAAAVSTAGRSLAGVPRATLTFDTAALPATALLASAEAADAARRDAAVLHCAAMLGAMTAAQAAAREHVQVRHQFGRPLASMQAVSHNIARIAADVALSSAAFDAAVAEAEAGGPGWRAAAALITSARAAGSVARLSHQCLGAMGITREHPLHRATLRLWAWRDEFQPGAALERRLGAAAVQAGREAVWDWSVHAATELTTRTSPWY